MRILFFTIPGILLKASKSRMRGKEEQGGRERENMKRTMKNCSDDLKPMRINNPKHDPQIRRTHRTNGMGDSWPHFKNRATEKTLELSLGCTIRNMPVKLNFFTQKKCIWRLKEMQGGFLGRHTYWKVSSPAIWHSERCQRKCFSERKMMLGGVRKFWTPKC